MATHGRGGLGRLVFGSVTDEVLRNGPAVPLLLIREPEEQAA
jgi:nucleotide-binding universal stress UspA family protein